MKNKIKYPDVKVREIKIIEVDEKRQIIDTKITDAGEVLRILVTTLGSFIVTLSEKNPDRQEKLTSAVHDTLDNMVNAGLIAEPIKDLN